MGNEAEAASGAHASPEKPSLSRRLALAIAVSVFALKDAVVLILLIVAALLLLPALLRV